jgi:DNA-3-methyladenine glycosylase
MKGLILQPEFFQRSTLLVARELLGKCLTLETGGQSRSWRVTEVEAYDGPADLASHARGGRRTARTETMFAAGGVWYVYLVYGMHWMLNIVTGAPDYPAAVLIRGACPEPGRGEGVNGPGKLTRHLGLDQCFNALPATRATGLYFTSVRSLTSNTKIIALPRVGVDYAGPIWSRKPYRFILHPN